MPMRRCIATKKHMFCDSIRLNWLYRYCSGYALKLSIVAEPNASEYGIMRECQLKQMYIEVRRVNTTTIRSCHYVP